MHLRCKCKGIFNSHAKRLRYNYTSGANANAMQMQYAAHASANGWLQIRNGNSLVVSLEKLYAPDELLDRAVLDNDGIDIGNVIEMKKTKRTFKGVVVRTHFTVRDRYNLPEIIIIPVAQLGRTTARLDEVILRCSTKRLVTLPTYLKLNHPDYEDE